MHHKPQRILLIEAPDHCASVDFIDACLVDLDIQDTREGRILNIDVRAGVSDTDSTWREASFTLALPTETAERPTPVIGARPIDTDDYIAQLRLVLDEALNDAAALRHSMDTDAPATVAAYEALTRKLHVGLALRQP